MASSGGADHFELNLTPLLDVVMQLIMFFMMCVNFVSDQVSQNVLLPTSASATEIMPKTDVDVLVINVEVARKIRVDQDGNPLRDTTTGEVLREVIQPKKTKIVFSSYDDPINSKEYTDAEEGVAVSAAQRALARLAREYRKKESLRSNVPADKAELKTVVVIRADEETRYGLVVQLIAQCTKEGFAKVELRALSKRQS